MPSIHYLNPPPNPFWDFVTGMEDHPFFRAYARPQQHPWHHDVQPHAPQPDQAEPTPAPETSETSKGKQPSVEDPPEVDPATLNTNNTQVPEEIRDMPFRGRGRFAQAFPEGPQHAPHEEGHEGRPCRGRGGFGPRRGHGHHGPPPFFFGPYGPWWAHEGRKSPPPPPPAEGMEDHHPGPHGPQGHHGPPRHGGPWAREGHNSPPPPPPGAEGHHGPPHHGPPRGGFHRGGPPFGGPPFGGPHHEGPHRGGPHRGGPHRGGPPHRHGPPPHHHGRPRPDGFNLGQFLGNLGERLGVDLAGAAEGLGVDRFTAPRASQDVDFEPRADIFEKSSDDVVHLSLPGAIKEDVGVDWDGENSVLRITGVVHRPGVDEEMLKQLVVDGRKRENGVFEKAIRLGTKRDPANIDIAGITAKMTDGVLVVRVPKVEVEHQKREVPITNSSTPSPTAEDRATLFDADQEIYDATPQSHTTDQKNKQTEQQPEADHPEVKHEKEIEVASEGRDEATAQGNEAEQLPTYEEDESHGDSDWEKYGSEDEGEGEYVKINVD